MSIPGSKYYQVWALFGWKTPVSCDVKMGNAGQIFRLGLSLFFEYNTPRIVHIRSKKVGIINRLLQLTIIAYVIG